MHVTYDIKIECTRFYSCVLSYTNTPKIHFPQLLYW